MLKNNALKQYIIQNLERLSIDELNSYIELSCIYTPINQATNQLMVNSLPDLKKTTIKTLEFSSLSGSLTQKIIKKYQNNCLRLEATILFENQTALELSQLIFDKYFPNNTRLKVILVNADYLNYNSEFYDIVASRPRISKVSGLIRKELCNLYDDEFACNTVSFLLHKSLNFGTSFSFLLPKYFLNNFDFSKIRDNLQKLSISHIYDFSEMAFKDTHQEFFSITLSKAKPISQVQVTSLFSNEITNINQEFITNNCLNFWTIYSTLDFRNWLKTMNFDIFNVYRDRQLKKSDFFDIGDIKVLKAINIPRDGTEVISTEKDKYLKSDQLIGLDASKFLNKNDVYLCPNLTTKPRLILKPKSTIASGSLAILIPKSNVALTEADIKYFASTEFEKFYNIARNLSRRSLNIDKQSVYIFGIRKV